MWILLISIGNIISVILISVLNLISILMSVQITIDYIGDHIRKGKFIKLGLIIPDSKLFILKLFSKSCNYNQSLNNCKYNDFLIESNSSFFMDLTKITIIYFRNIWSLFMAFSSILIY